MAFQPTAPRSPHASTPPGESGDERQDAKPRYSVRGRISNCARVRSRPPGIAEGRELGPRQLRGAAELLILRIYVKHAESLLGIHLRFAEAAGRGQMA
jgi:hypothetical protein